jgi:hypothetical protein
MSWVVAVDALICGVKGFLLGTGYVFFASLELFDLLIFTQNNQVQKVRICGIWNQSCLVLRHFLVELQSFLEPLSLFKYEAHQVGRNLIGLDYYDLLGSFQIHLS